MAIATGSQLTGTQEKIAKLEAARGFAAFYVLLHHSIPANLIVGGIPLGFCFRFGQEAVIAFFLMSGFVIAHSFECGTDKTFATFFAKRWLRIYVPLMFVMATSYFLLCLRQHSIASPQMKEALLNLTMVQDLQEHLPGVIAGPYLGNAPLWSLSYEWWFYMAFFISMFVVKQRDLRAASQVIFLVTTTATIVYCFWPSQPVRFVMYFAIWWAGAHAALTLARQQHASFFDVAAPLVPLLISTGLLMTNAWFRVPDISMMRLGSSPVLEARHFASAVAVLCAAFTWKRLRWAGFNILMRPFAYLAPISFCIYISHWLFFKQLPLELVPSNPVIAWLFSLVCTLVFSYVVELLVYPRIRTAAFGALCNARHSDQSEIPE